MVTKEQALTTNYFHYTGNGPCTRTVGPRGGVKTHIVEVRRSGATQVWKTRPAEFSIPVKYGLYESARITNDDNSWHTADDCPLNQEGKID